MKKTIKINTKFNLGDDVSELYYNDDIGAWDVSYWKVGNIHYDICNKTVIYFPEEYPDDPNSETDEMFVRSLDAAKEAKKRNREGLDRYLDPQDY